MIFTPLQIEELLGIIDYHFLFTITTSFGVDVLSEKDKDVLRSFGVKLEDLGNVVTNYDKMYLLGKLTSVLSEKQASTLDYSDFLKYIKTGQYIPLNKFEQASLDVAKRKSYIYLKGLNDSAKKDFEKIILDKEILVGSQYRAAVKEELEKGVVERKALQSIVSDLGHRVNTWQHDWGRIVATEMQDIYNKGRLDTFRGEKGEDSLVYKHTYDGACRHCIRLHLTKGIGSRPIVFKISELITNGSNIGKKVDDWKATVGPEHPFCR